MKFINPIAFLWIVMASVCCSCGNRTYEELAVVDKVDLQRYSGSWYEIMKLPNSFEDGLKCVEANYSLKENGDIMVVNSGHKIEEPSKIKTAEGTAWASDPAEPTKLRVRFFWPFSGQYWIITLDPEYKYVMIGEPSREYLWILSREKTLSQDIITTLLAQAKRQGFDITKVERTPQDCN